MILLISVTVFGALKVNWERPASPMCLDLSPKEMIVLCVWKCTTIKKIVVCVKKTTTKKIFVCQRKIQSSIEIIKQRILVGTYGEYLLENSLERM